jgi:nucleotide-binding universal stress UspA family protein
MNRILVGIDGSDCGWSALAQAALLAQATGASLQIAHVIPPVPALAAEGYQLGAPAWMEAEDTYARDLLREATARVKDTGVQVESISVLGGPAEKLADLALAKEVTMAVVGHRGRNLAARLLVGSVADRLVQISSKPVLVVH